MLHRIANSTGWLITVYVTNLSLVALVFAVAEDESYGDALWWGIVTSTTTGYGDFFPTTLVGRLVGTELMLSNILIVALIVSRIISGITVDLHHFSDAEQELMKQHLAEIDAEGDELRAMVRQLLVEQRQQAEAESELLRAEVRRLEDLLRAALPPGLPSAQGLPSGAGHS